MKKPGRYTAQIEARKAKLAEGTITVATDENLFDALDREAFEQAVIDDLGGFDQIEAELAAQKRYSAAEMIEHLNTLTK